MLLQQVTRPSPLKPDGGAQDPLAAGREATRPDCGPHLTGARHLPLPLPGRLGHPGVGAQAIWGSEKAKEGSRHGARPPDPQQASPASGTEPGSAPVCWASLRKQSRYRHTERYVNRARLDKEISFPGGSDGKEATCNAGDGFDP